LIKELELIRQHLYRSSVASESPKLLLWSSKSWTWYLGRYVQALKRGSQQC